MPSITIEFKTARGLREELRTLLSGFNDMAKDHEAPEDTQEAQVKETKAKKPAATQPATEAAVAPAGTPNETASAATASPSEAPTGEVIGDEQLRAVAGEAAKRDKDKVRALVVDKYKVAGVTQVPSAQRAAFLADLAAI